MTKLTKILYWTVIGLCVSVVWLTLLLVAYVQACGG